MSPDSSSVRCSGDVRRSNRSRATLAIVSCSSVNVKSISGCSAGELVQHQVVIERLEVDLHRHADRDVCRVDVREVGHDPHALLEFDQRHDVGVVEEREARLVRHDVAVDGAAARRLDRLPVQGSALRAHGAGRVAQLPAAAAALDQEFVVPQPIPEELGVRSDRRCHSGRHQFAGLNRSTRKRCRPRTSPSWLVYVVSQVRKKPVPSAVFFSSDTDSYTAVALMTSPSRG